MLVPVTAKHLKIIWKLFSRSILLQKKFNSLLNLHRYPSEIIGYGAVGDRALRYLATHSILALQLGGGDDFKVANDLLFADNTQDRKSS